MHPRKTAPKVVDGVVQKKNNHSITSSEKFIVYRERPYKGFKHVLGKRDIHDFIDLIDDWEEVGSGITEIALEEGGDDFDGLYRHFYHENTATIYLSAWPKDMWVEFSEEYFQEHVWLFDLFRVTYEQKDKEWLCFFTEEKAKAFMLLHIFLHELGHHVDRMRSKNQKWVLSGEQYAEDYANEKFDEIWPKYVSFFGMP